MKVLIRNFKKETFYTTPDRWVADPAEATDFITRSHAVIRARRLNLPNLEIVLIANRRYPGLGQRIER